MIPAIIGISSGLLVILVITILKQLDKKVVYGFILSGIGFLYVGFVWTDLHALVINSFQAITFFFIAYYGMVKNINILAAGFFLHGGWDMAYHFFNEPGLIPPHYDWFCLSIDFTFAIYILVFKNQLQGIPSHKIIS